MDKKIWILFVSDGAWYDQELLSDKEVLKKKKEIIEKTKAREEVGGYFIKASKEQSSIAVNPDSKRLTIVRRVNPAQKCKKNLHGIYE